MEQGFRGRLALVTGGSKGIGFACAQALASAGCRLALVARDKASLDAARNKLVAESKVDVAVLEADLSDPAQVERIAATFGAVDILVNSAGAVPRGSLLEVEPVAMREGFEGKLWGTIHMCRAYYAQMKARRCGVIVNIIGIAGLRPNPKSIATSTVNAALIAFTQALGAESPDHNVRVVGVNPGLVRTGRTAALFDPSASTEGAYTKLVASLPFGRVCEADEVAKAVIFLASDLASYCSGEVIAIDGGSRFRL